MQQIHTAMIRLYLDTYSLSSALPDAFEIDQVDRGSCEVSIFLQGQLVYTTNLYADNRGSTTFYEFRQIVEQYMETKNLSLASLEVSVDYGDGGGVYEDKYIVFSRYRNACEYPLDFLEQHFLTNRTHYIIPRNRYASIPFFVQPDNLPTCYMDCIFDEDGVISSYRYDFTMRWDNVPSIVYYTISPPSVKNWIDRQEGGDCGKLLSFTIHVGLRSLTVFVSDEEPTIEFSFRNSYNVTETLFFFGTSTFKTEVSKKEALARGVTSFYDKVISRKWEVQTVALSQEEAHWYNEFLESQEVTMGFNQDYDYIPVLISDITSEISDSSKDLVHIKFSWRYDDNARWLYEDRSSQQFAAPFTDTFE